VGGGGGGFTQYGDTVGGSAKEWREGTFFGEISLIHFISSKNQSLCSIKSTS